MSATEPANSPANLPHGRRRWIRRSAFRFHPAKLRRPGGQFRGGYRILIGLRDRRQDFDGTPLENTFFAPRVGLDRFEFDTRAQAQEAIRLARLAILALGML